MNAEPEAAFRMRLAIGESITALLTPESDPLPFPADVPVEATLPAGRITDLNIMVRRGAWSAEVRRVKLDDRHAVQCRRGALLTFALDPCRLDEEALEPGDALLLEPGDEAVLHAGRGRGRLVVIELSPIA